MTPDPKPAVIVPPPLSPDPLVTGPLTALLKTPQQLGERLAAKHELASHARHYLAAVVLCYAGFGLATGLFGGWEAGFTALAKAPLIAILSFALCLPSLYVFSCLGGSPLAGSQIPVLGLACLAMVGLLLIALAPVVWLFSVSTSSLPFVVMLDVLTWVIGLVFAARFVGRLRDTPLLRNAGGLRVWLLVLALTTLQMTTFLRPVLTAQGGFWQTGEKQFFLSHFARCFDTAK
jgi:hypothetical protein